MMEPIGRPLKDGRHNRYIPVDICEYKNHKIEPNSGLIYWDEAREIIRIRICKKCYAEHILRYFPESKIAEYIAKYPSEYGIESVDKTFELIPGTQQQPSLFTEANHA